jgi:hypothetical protein|tara:strand:- start:16 stop:198 length:183 start_codon:yes stop_codon:yes gene_type:complete
MRIFFVSIALLVFGCSTIGKEYGHWGEKSSSSTMKWNKLQETNNPEENWMNTIWDFLKTI